MLLNFAGMEGEFADKSKAQVVILPVPFEVSSSWQRGSKNGPRAIIEASQHLEVLDVMTMEQPYKKIIYTAPPIKAMNAQEMIRKVSSEIKKYPGKLVVMLGGEHTVTVGAIAAHKGEDFSIISLDAHTDMRDEYEGNRLSHACTMARCHETADVIHVGVRSMDPSEYNKAFKIFFAHNLSEKRWMDTAINLTKQKVYVSIDLDVFDPSIMPSTGTPEPGGMLWYDMIEFLKKIAENRTIIGFDVVELMPNKNNKAPDFLAAKLIYTFLALNFQSRPRNL